MARVQSGARKSRTLKKKPVPPPSVAVKSDSPNPKARFNREESLSLEDAYRAEARKRPGAVTNLISLKFWVRTNYNQFWQEHGEDAIDPDVVYRFALANIDSVPNTEWIIKHSGQMNNSDTLAKYIRHIAIIIGDVRLEAARVARSVQHHSMMSLFYNTVPAEYFTDDGDEIDFSRFTEADLPLLRRIVSRLNIRTVTRDEFAGVSQKFDPPFEEMLDLVKREWEMYHGTEKRRTLIFRQSQ